MKNKENKTMNDNQSNLNEAVIIPFPEKKPETPIPKFLTLQEFGDRTEQSIHQLETVSVILDRKIKYLEKRLIILWIFNSILLGLEIGQLIRKFL